jgi:glycosyltransferase involved in cell wall biosynthesis
MSKPSEILCPRNLQIMHSVGAGVFRAEWVVGIGMHNQAASIRRCLDSVFSQELGGRKLAVVLLDDQSSDDWQERLDELWQCPELVVVSGRCGNASRTRNAILDFVDECFPHAKWVARLDADDCFSTSNSLLAACELGETSGVQYVLGGNRLVMNGVLCDQENPGTLSLKNSAQVLSLLGEMANGTAVNELPSCNLVLAARSGWRYPDVRSAEDHWLVADLLLNFPDQGVLLESPYYCDYTLGGNETYQNRTVQLHAESRQRLFDAVMLRQELVSADGELLGYGQEGVVRLVDGWVEKQFYCEAISSAEVARLKALLKSGAPFFPDPEWNFSNGRWSCRYLHQSTTPANQISREQAEVFLRFCLQQGIVCKNIKRDNFRVTLQGDLCFVDIGKDVVSMRMDYFRDSAARLYAVAVLGCSDRELLRRSCSCRQEEVFDEMPGFTSFFHDLLWKHAESLWEKVPCSAPISLPCADEVTLLIKCCAMDAAFLDGQVRYISTLLSKPRPFHEIILLIDPYEGPFLRQYADGDPALLMGQASRLLAAGLIDRILVAPSDGETVTATNARWFNLSVPSSHTHRKAPVVPQIWGFDQVESRYVLQCDLDVLIGRHDLEHDYLSDMIKACSSARDVLGVAFNIPHPIGTQNQYGAPSGEYVPEVRCGLLDLERVKACRPLPNYIQAGALGLTWHRSLLQHQKEHGYRTLRGGDARTFYLHPENHWKTEPDQLAVIRDLIAQGEIPAVQLRNWNLMAGQPSEWAYPQRTEQIIFLLKGSNTPPDKLQRCIASLRMQEDQQFGMVVIDDASDRTDLALLQHLLKPMQSRATLIRRHKKTGRIPNFITSIRDICTDPESLVVILDLDDALISTKTVSLLRNQYENGHDVIVGGQFRVDKPLKLYVPDFKNIRQKWGGEVWIHLRSFRKRLFDAIADDALKLDADWIEECTDYATMIPMVEMAKSPIFISDYLYCHEPSTVRTPAARLRKEHIVRRILEKPPHVEQREFA